MMTNEQFLGALRGALNHLYEPDRLRQSPLAALFDVANRLDTFSALQRILTEAIESLEPEANEPPQSHAWEIYEPLFYRYVQQLDQRQVAKQLGMSVRHLRRKEHAALEVLASRLWEQFDLEAKLRQDTGQRPTPVQGTVSSPTVSEELAWLKDVPLESPTDLAQLLPDVLALAGPLAAQHKVRLDTTIAGDVPSLSVHAVALSQTLLNLLSVAIHQATGGQVTISASALPLEVEIKVQGTYLRQGPQPVLDDDEASLDLARQLADLCRGRLEVARSGDRPQQARSGDRPQQEGGEGAFSATLTLPSFVQLPVLVVDDNADTLQLLQRYAVDTRYRLVTTRDPEQALSLAEKFSPKIIVLDVMMPQADGWKVMARLRQHPLTGHIPIVVCTILAQEEMAFALGASGFVRKPVTRQAFLAALDRQAERLGNW
jgi:CheY-like chemotaxis protein